MYRPSCSDSLTSLDSLMMAGINVPETPDMTRRALKTGSLQRVAKQKSASCKFLLTVCSVFIDNLTVLLTVWQFYWQYAQFLLTIWQFYWQYAQFLLTVWQFYWQYAQFLLTVWQFYWQFAQFSHIIDPINSSFCRDLIGWWNLFVKNICVVKYVFFSRYFLNVKYLHQACLFIFKMLLSIIEGSQLNPNCYPQASWGWECEGWTVIDI